MLFNAIEQIFNLFPMSNVKFPKMAFDFFNKIKQTILRFEKIKSLANWFVFMTTMFILWVKTHNDENAGFFLELEQTNKEYALCS